MDQSQELPNGRANALAVPRMLATGAAVTASTAFRLSVRNVRLFVGRVPGLVQLASGTLGADAGRSQAELRDELLALLRDTAEGSWLELRRGVDEFDAYTRPNDPDPEPSRPYRVKP